jgi:outer membrane lipoprotein-sorting protein
MNLLLAAVLLVQDKSAEATLAKIEESFEKAQTVSIKFKWEPVMTKGPLAGKENMTTGTLTLKDGNRMLLQANMRLGENTNKAVIISDGTTLYRNLKGTETKRESTPPSLKRGVILSSFRAGIMQTVFFTRLSNLKVDPEELESALAHPVETCDVNGGEDDGEAKTLTYKIRVRPEHTAAIKLWYDPKRLLPLKRTIRDDNRDSGSVTETFEEVSLNADIPNEKFKLPEEKK